MGAPLLLERSFRARVYADLPEHERRLLVSQRRLLWAVALGLFAVGTALDFGFGQPSGEAFLRDVLARAAILVMLLVVVGIASHVALTQTAERLERLHGDRAALEAALDAHERRDRQKDLALANLSHDLRTPLTAISGRLQLLERRAATLPEPQRATVMAGLREIAHTTERMAAMTDDLLDVARLQAGQPLDLRRSATDLVELARRAVADHQATTTAHALRLSTTAPSVVGEWDAARLARVLDNLLANAEKYSPEGGEIDVDVAITLDGAGAWALLDVRDHGIGVLQGDQERVFEPLQRGTNVDGATEGVGLGLAGVRQIVEQHGGTVAVESEPGHGSTFTVRLPMNA